MKKSPLRRERKIKSKRYRLMKLAWKLCSLYVRQRDKGVCFTCGKKGDWKTEMQAGHYKHGKGTPIYFDERNIHCQCKRCNHFLSGNGIIYLRKLQDLYGKDVADYLIKEGRKTHYFTIKELESIIEYYTRKLKELEE